MRSHVSTDGGSVSKSKQETCEDMSVSLFFFHFSCQLFVSPLKDTL